MMSRCCWFLFFSLSFAIKKEKKEEKEELKKSSCEKEAKKISSQRKGGAFVCKYERIDEFKLSSFF
tara:strand:- start:465 stop:662 length:198 start_codon:yes stop_codon:yes gene_type:complete